MSTLSLSFPDETYTEANPPASATLKSDLSKVETGHNAHEADTDNPHSVALSQIGAYPVGSIYINAAVATNPATLLGFGTWLAFGAGKVLIGVDSGDTDFDVVNSSTGSAGSGGTKTIDVSHTHTGPSHTHTGTTNAGGGSIEGGSENEEAFSEPNHTHTFTSAAAGTGATGTALSATQSIVQPYITCYMWRRTA